MTKVRWAHLKLREEYGWWKINANLAIEEIHEEIWASVRNLLEGLQAPAPRKESYSYSGFQAIGDIITDNRQTIIKPEIPKPENKQIHPEDNSLLVEKLNANAKLPQKAHLGDAGYDLYSSDYYSISPYSQVLVSTGIKMAIPDGYAGLIWDKSGLAFEGLKTMGGVIDSNYRGEIKVIIKNLSEEFYNIVPGQKIAQIIVQAVSDLTIKESPISDQTVREANGFGSSGKF